MAALRGLADAVLLVDGEGRLQLGERGSRADVRAGRSQEWVGVSGLELIHPDDLDLVLVSLGTVQDKEVGTPLELRVRTVERLAARRAGRVPRSQGATRRDDRAVASAI